MWLFLQGEGTVFFYESISLTAGIALVVYLVALIGLNELSRINKWVAGAIMGLLICFIPQMQKKYIVCIPAAIFAINILEACIRDFQLFSVSGMVDGYLVVGGPWNIINGVAGIFNALCICGFFGIIVSRGKKKDFVWPDMMWFWIIGYDLWNFAYTYNSVSDRSAYCGLVLLLACTIPAFFIKRGHG
ncbi:MAG: DUF5692 family protein [Raoultibacter sp.]